MIACYCFAYNSAPTDEKSRKAAFYLCFHSSVGSRLLGN
jgi:hypothetical protein